MQAIPSLHISTVYVLLPISPVGELLITDNQDVWGYNRPASSQGERGADVDRVTPSYVMYDEFKTTWGISHVKLVAVLFSPEITYDGRTMLEQVKDNRSRLSRDIVRSTPGSFRRIQFRYFQDSAQAIVAHILQRLGKQATVDIISRFAGPACNEMCASLRSWNLDASIYSNMVSAILDTPSISQVDQATLLVELFIETGCLGDSRTAVDDVMHFMLSVAPSSYRTAAADSAMDLSASQFMPAANFQPARLALYRVHEGHITSQAYVLSNDPSGTVIGSFATTGNTITDVDATVSRRHLLVWRDERGRWMTRGLGSTNGSYVIRKATGAKELIEPAREPLSPATGTREVEIFPDDILILGKTTAFLVAIAPEYA